MNSRLALLAIRSLPSVVAVFFTKPAPAFLITLLWLTTVARLHAVEPAVSIIP